jgi:gliding motility-associated-like protein
MTLFLLLIACKKTHLKNDFCDCADSQSTYVIDTITLTIPNLFTPNADLINDFWRPININKFSDSKVKVTRPGLLGGTVFESSNPILYWDAQHNNKNLQEGKYKYEITINGQIITGYVCIYRGFKKYDKIENFDCLKNCVPEQTGDSILY